MALYHFCVKQVKRSEGSSVVASAAYRAGERLHSERYDEYSDYTKKAGVRSAEIILAPQAPREYADRETFWNAVEAAEKRPDAQLAYSFDFALQNELTDEENRALARQFIMENFVAKGMSVDCAFHDPDREPGGIPNPHVHVMAPIRPINPDGSWGAKQHQVPVLDESGNRIWDEKHKRWKFNALPTTDWGTPETLEEWRKNWCDLVNAKFAEKGIPERLDWRSYERQGTMQVAQVHEGPNVRAMDNKGIRTEKGDYNRWVKATNALLQSIREKLAALSAWIGKLREELEIDEQPSPSLKQLLIDYSELQSKGRQNFSRFAKQKASVSTLKTVANAMVFLSENGINTLDELDSKVSTLIDQADALKDSMKSKSRRISQLKEALRQVEFYKENLPIYEEMLKSKYKFKRAKEAYKEKHEGQLKLFYIARRILKEVGMPEKYDPVVVASWKRELSQLQQQYDAEYAELKPLREEQKKYSDIQYYVHKAVQARNEEEQTKEQQSVKRKKTDMDL